MVSTLLLAAAADGIAKLGAGLGAGIAAVGAGVGIGRIGGQAMDAMARQPEVMNKIDKTTIINNNIKNLKLWFQHYYWLPLRMELQS